jgi:hypothetical protein
MIIKHIAIRHFRGIKQLDWHVDSWLVCLLGPGDSTKTTILDAIELALLPRWFTPFTDADFYQTDTESPIQIEVTLGQLTDEIVHEDCCGLFLRGYLPSQPIHDDPEDGYEPVVTVGLTVVDDLEPQWKLVKNGSSEPKALTYRDRERFCMARIDETDDATLVLPAVVLDSFSFLLIPQMMTTAKTLAVQSRFALIENAELRHMRYSPSGKKATVRTIIIERLAGVMRKLLRRSATATRLSR